MYTTTHTDTMRHVLNPLRLRGWLRRLGLSRSLSRQLAGIYQALYSIVL